MKITKSTLKIMTLAGVLALSLASCKKKGCTDPTANNYNSEAKKTTEAVLLTTMIGTLK